MPEALPESPLSNDPLWYKDAIIYQTHVKAFHDSAGDGIGDFRGLTSKLAYLEELGVNTLWLLPFYPSPLKDDGYDIASYTGVHPQYGTIRDFTRFLRAAHGHGLRVVTELVINHTSDQHPWFRRARRSPPGSTERDFYVWSETPQKYRKARIIFKDFEPSNWTFDAVANAYYWHRFYAHQPDLNFDNPAVHQALFRVLDFWMRRGVDGLRLDAVPYLYERDGTSCENLPETHEFLKKLRRYVDERYPNRMLLAEANQWPDDAAAYFGKGDECHMNFHFPIMPRMFMAVRMEDRYPIVDIMRQTPSIPAICQWATFLRNHDELTLEMVTDRERDYMYQAFAREREMRINLGIRRRLAPLLNNDRRALELMNALLFSMPGSPIIYYGDEIGMGDNVYLGDRNGVRTPMQWSADRNAGFSRANPQRLYLPVIIDPQFHYENVNVESQENNPQSLLWWMRRLIGLRKRFSALGRGSLEFLPSSNQKILSFLREHEDQRILVVANLSRFAQQVDLDLARFQGMTPVEAFGQTRFRAVGQEPYYLTLGPYAFYWFSLEMPKTQAVAAQVRPAPVEIAVAGSWENVLEGRPRVLLERALPAYLQSLLGQGGRERKIESARIVDDIRLSDRLRTARLLVAQVEYSDGSVEVQAVPLGLAASPPPGIQEELPQDVVARLKMAGVEEGILHDAFWGEPFALLLLGAIARRRRFLGAQMELAASMYVNSHRLASGLEAERRAPPPPVSREEGGAIQPDVSFHRLSPHPPWGSVRTLQAQARWVSVAFDDKLLLKTYRKLDPAVNPDLEVGRFLTEHGFAHAPATLGALELGRPGQEPMTLAILRQFIPHEKTAWQYTLDALGQYFERTVAQGAEMSKLALPREDVTALARREAPEAVRDLFGFFLMQAALLGQRSAEFHSTLASSTEDAAFSPEPFNPFYQRSQYQALHNLRVRVVEALRNRLADLTPTVRGEAQAVLDAEGDIQQRFRAMRDRKFESLRIRCHGSYHLGQVLYTGKDFFITDFEGDARLSLSERRGKYSALRDVASMLRSLHYAAHAAMLAAAEGTLPAGVAALEPWYRLWREWVPASFLRGYLLAAGNAAFLPADKEELRVLLEIRVLQEALVELWHELEQRPDWAIVPLQGILQTLYPAGPPRAADA